MAAVLSPSVIEASNKARDVFLRAIDPGAFPPPPRPTVGGAPPPPGPAAKRLMSGAYYGDSFFRMISEIITKQNTVLKTGTTTENLDYAGWFNYFFAEAKKSAQPEAMGRILSVLFDLDSVLSRDNLKLVQKAGFTFPASLSTDFARMIAIDPAVVPFGVLDYLLNEGFETFPPVDAKSGGVDTGEGTVEDPKVSHVFGTDFDLQSATSTQPTDRHTTPNYLIFYRGDNRLPKMVIEHGGARCRADLAHWRKAAHVDEPWHPWKDAVTSKKMWIRKGNADNDYFTVNSIGMDFHISCAYPMLRLSEIDKTLTGDIRDWTDAERARLRSSGKADFCLIQPAKGQQKEFALCDKTRVYLCAFKDDTLLSPTYTRNTYPEMGVRDVALNQIIAWVEIERFHHNADLRKSGSARPSICYDSTTEGSTMTIVVRDWGWMNGATGAKNVLAIANPAVFENRLNSFKGSSFEINHSRLLSRNSTTYIVSTRQHAPNVWATVAPATLKK